MKSKATYAAMAYDAVSRFVNNECDSEIINFVYDEGDCYIIVKNKAAMYRVYSLTKLVDAMITCKSFIANAEIKELEAKLKAFGELEDE